MGLILLLYLALVLGMVSHALYRRLERPRRRRGKLRLESLLAPLLVSPIVFLPLASLLSEVSFGRAQAGRAMPVLLLIAYENGFFWREFFANHYRAEAEAPSLEPGRP